MSTYRRLGFNACWRIGQRAENEAHKIDDSLKEIGNAPLGGLVATNGTVRANIRHLWSCIVVVVMDALVKESF